MRGLLESIPSWSVQPAEIIIVDDCSLRPVRTDGLPWPCEVVRFDTHRGLAKAKHHGPGLASREYILSMDCDTRVSPDWLERCLPHAARPDVGLVSGPLSHAPGDDIVSRYLKCFGDNHNLDVSGPVDFAPGNARLMRSEVWKKIGGLSGHHRDICEDRYLCALLRENEYKIFVEKKAKIFQVRKLSRLAVAKRFFNWNFEAYKIALPRCDYFYDHAYLNLVLDFLQLCLCALEINEPAFVYLAFLNLVLTVSSLIDYGVARMDFPREMARGWRQAVLWHLRGFPAVSRLLAKDLGWADTSESRIDNPDRWSTRWDRTFRLLDTFAADKGIWGWMENEGVKLIENEDLTIDHDFSFHVEYNPS